MNYAAINAIVRTVLYEGAILYPYRPSMKNVQRWNFGCLFSPGFAAAHAGEASDMQTQCIVRAGPGARVEVAVRFLHVIQRTVASATDPHRCMELLEIEGTHYRPWQEVEEKEVQLGAFEVSELLAGVRSMQVGVAGRCWDEVIDDARQRPAGVLHRRQEDVALRVVVRAEDAGGGCMRLTVRVANATDCAGMRETREAALGQALVSTHTLLGVSGGEFISMTDPPRDAVAAVERCQNIRTWPVLVGAPGETEMMLSSPIILYDHPQIAPESAGDFFDGTEIDEMLTLRIMTLTEAEKREMLALDPRARQLLERTHAQANRQMMALHGTRRAAPMADMGGTR